MRATAYPTSSTPDESTALGSATTSESCKVNTHTLRFEEFTIPPKYAILSHRWEGEEVSYAEYCAEARPTGRRWTKILGCCETARSRGHNYVWIDSCCIDKRSSAELSEAINSMWDWYSQATECLAFLVDVSPIPQESDQLGRKMLLKGLQLSEWFRRGWTLQELLAPRVVTFYTSHWQVIGEKCDPDILSALSQVTRIPKPCLLSQTALRTRCVAHRFSWAARRTTSRPEDMAYCLLGLMGVNMPLLYGEGDKAFLRLQQEIVKQSDDESIFAWRFIAPPTGFMSGVLAPKVQDFSESGDVNLLQGERPPYAITNKGLEIRSTATYLPSAEIYILQLNCSYTVKFDGEAQEIPCEIAIRKDHGAFFRVLTSRMSVHTRTIASEATFKESLRRATYYIRLSRWDHDYQPAIVMLQKFARNWRARRNNEDISKAAISRAAWHQVQRQDAENP
ncbi:HET-domain-containing protein [Teratosphaeria destructans]|uniref:HET-domain-containing protein n=1 Tax=Teratosphaeria destructans TaxID=418781 RepID=A0A9W7T0Y0_9PEZI|nr:HET-domain-containing protein [Teratosphaeria destructans]